MARRAFAQTMSGYALTPLAKADIFDIWVYLAENSKSVADRVKQAIYYACAMSRRTALARSYPPRPHSPSTPILDASPLSQLHSCLPARNGPASNRCRPPRETRYSSHPEAAPRVCAMICVTTLVSHHPFRGRSVRASTPSAPSSAVAADLPEPDSSASHQPA
jgi:plasmid stabilization system protein ParE